MAQSSGLVKTSGEMRSRRLTPSRQSVMWEPDALGSCVTSSRRPRPVCVTCLLSCLDEELLLLRDRDEIFCDMVELRSSEPIVAANWPVLLRLEGRDHSSAGRGRGRREGERERSFQRQALQNPFSLLSLKNALGYLE